MFSGAALHSALGANGQALISGAKRVRPGSIHSRRGSLNVRYGPNSGHITDMPKGPSRANRRHPRPRCAQSGGAPLAVAGSIVRRIALFAALANQVPQIPDGDTHKAADRKEKQKLNHVPRISLSLHLVCCTCVEAAANGSRIVMIRCQYPIGAPPLGTSVRTSFIVHASPVPHHGCSSWSSAIANKTYPFSACEKTPRSVAAYSGARSLATVANH
jgi:hypothetical protein